MEQARNRIDTRKNTYNAILVLFGGFSIAYNISIAFHELGHTIAVFIDGGQTQEFVLNPFSWSWNLGQDVSNLAFTAWGGVTFGLLLALAPLLLVCKIRTAGLLFLCKLVAACALLINGIYLLVGCLFDFGDGGELVRLGTKPSIIVSIGIVYMLVSLAFWSSLQRHLGLSNSTPLRRRLFVIIGGIAPYMILIFLYNLLHNSRQILIWAGFAAIGVIASFIVAVIGNLWDIYRTKKADCEMIQQNYAYKILIAGMLVIMLEFLIFGAPNNPF